MGEMRRKPVLVAEHMHAKMTLVILVLLVVVFQTPIHTLGIVQHASNISLQRALVILLMLTASGQLHLSAIQAQIVYQIFFVSLRRNLMFCLLLQM